MVACALVDGERARLRELEDLLEHPTAGALPATRGTAARPGPHRRAASRGKQGSSTRAWPTRASRGRSSATMYRLFL